MSSAFTAGALPVTLAGGTSDPINMTGTTQTLTSYADDDGDTKVEVERTSDNDTVHIKAGVQCITATSTGVTITNLTVTTTTQANELKITDILFELNADGNPTTDAGMIIEEALQEIMLPLFGTNRQILLLQVQLQLMVLHQVI